MEIQTVSGSDLEEPDVWTYYLTANLTDPKDGVYSYSITLHGMNDGAVYFVSRTTVFPQKPACTVS